MECQMSVRADWVPGKTHEPEKRPIDTNSHLLVSYPEVVSLVRSLWWRLNKFETPIILFDSSFIHVVIYIP